MAILKYLRVGDTAELQDNGIRWIRIPSHVASGKQSGVIFESEDGTPVYTWFSDAHSMYYKVTEPTTDTDGTVIGDSATGVTADTALTDDKLVRGKGGALGVQTTTITITDSSMNMAGVGTLGCGAITTTGAFTFSGANPDIIGGDTNGALSITAAATTSLGGIIKLYGDTHGSLAKDIEFYTDATKVLEYDASETIWDFNSKNVKGVGTLATGDITVDTTLVLNTGSITDTSNAISFGNEALSTSGTLASGALTVTGAGSVSTTFTVGTDLTVTAGDLDVAAGFIAVDDDQSVRFGDSGEADGYIKYEAASANLIFYDRTVSDTYTLSQLISGTALNPIVTGDLTIANGKFDWAQGSTSVASTWAFSNTAANCIDFTTANTTHDALVINANDITSGSLLLLNTDQASGTFNFLECLQESAADAFTIGFDGITIIKGDAIGTAALTLTTGDFIVTDGRLRVDIATDGAANGHIFNSDDNGTSSIPLLQLITTDSSNDQALLNLTHVATGDIDVMSLVNAGTGYGISMALNHAASEGLEMVMVSDATGNGLYIEGVATNGYLGSSTTAMIGVKQDGTLATSASTAVRIDFDGTPAASGMGYALLIDDDADAVATTYAMSINSANNVPLHLEAVSTSKNALVIETAAATVSSVIIDGATNDWAGGAGVGMLHLVTDATTANATGSLLGCYNSGTAVVASARGFLARFIDTATVSSVPPAYAVEINSTNNFGLNIVTGVATATNLTLSGLDAQSAAIINVVGTTTNGWDGASGVGMVNLAGKGAHAQVDAPLLNITDVTGAMLANTRGSCLRLVDSTVNGADSWIAYMSTTSNDGLLINTGHAADINLKLSSTAAGTGQMFEVDGTTGDWVGANDVGMVDIHTDGVLIAGGNLLRVDSSGANEAASHAVEIITSGALEGSTSGTALNITDTGATAGTSYAVYIASTSNEALHVDTGKVLIDEDLTIGVNTTDNAGHLDIWDGAGGSKPAYIRLASSDGSETFIFAANNGTLRYHTAIPTADGDGSAV